MAEFEELKITVTLVDNARAQLKEYQEAMKSIAGTGSGGGQVGSSVEMLTKKTDLLKLGMKQLGLEAKGAGALVEKLAEGLGSAAGRVGSFATAIVVATNQVGKMASAMQDTAESARLMGTTLGHMKNIQEQLGKFGISEENAAKLTASAINAHLEAARSGQSRFFDDLAKRLPKDVDAIQKYRKELAKEGSPEDYLRTIKQGEDILEQSVRKRMKGRSEEEVSERVAKEKQIFREQQGHIDELEKMEDIKNETAEHADHWDKVDKNSKAAAASYHAIWQDITNIKDLFADSLFDPKQSPFPTMLSAAQDIIHSIYQTFEEGEKKLEGKNFWERFFYIDPKVIEFLRTLTSSRKDTGPLEGTATGGAVPLLGDYSSLGKGGEGIENLGENTRELKRLNDQLYDMLHQGPDDIYGRGADELGGRFGETPSASEAATDGGTRGPKATEPSVRTGPRTATTPEHTTPSTPQTSQRPAPPSSVTRPDVFPMGAPNAILPPQQLPKAPHFVFGSSASNVGTSGPEGGGVGAGGVEDLHPRVQGFLAAVRSHEAPTAGEAWSATQDERDYPGGYAKRYKDYDFGHYQMNYNDVADLERKGVPHSRAIRIRGGEGNLSLAENEKNRLSKDQQSLGVGEYIEKMYPSNYKKLIDDKNLSHDEAYDQMRAATHSSVRGKDSWKWWGLAPKSGRSGGDPADSKAHYDAEVKAANARFKGAAAGAAVGGGFAPGPAGGLPEGQKLVGVGAGGVPSAASAASSGGGTTPAATVPTMEELGASRRRIDGQAARREQERINAEGEIHVDVPNPRPNQSRLFQHTPMERSPQMQPAQQGPQEPAQGAPPPAGQ